MGLSSWKGRHLLTLAATTVVVAVEASRVLIARCVKVEMMDGPRLARMVAVLALTVVRPDEMMDGVKRVAMAALMAEAIVGVDQFSRQRVMDVETDVAINLAGSARSQHR